MRAAGSTGGECPCEVTGFLIDPDRSGTNVREQPRGPIIKKLPLQDDPNFEVGVYVTVKASRQGWLQIASVADTNDQAYRDAWVYGRLIAVDTRNYDGSPFNLYRNPDRKSPVIGRIRGERRAPILGCCGRWIYTTIQDSGKALSGWLEPEMQCPNAVTNCN